MTFEERKEKKRKEKKRKEKKRKEKENVDLACVNFILLGIKVGWRFFRERITQNNLEIYTRKNQHQLQCENFEN